MNKKDKAIFQNKLKNFLEYAEDHIAELELIDTLYKGSSVNAGNKDFVDTIKEDAFEEARKTIADGEKLFEMYRKMGL